MSFGQRSFDRMSSVRMGRLAECRFIYEFAKEFRNSFMGLSSNFERPEVLSEVLSGFPTGVQSRILPEIYSEVPTGILSGIPKKFI